MMFGRLECSCCGGDAGKWAQWHNRDTGYGVCRACVDWTQQRGMPADELHRCYGVEGTHYGPMPRYTARTIDGRLIFGGDTAQWIADRVIQHVRDGNTPRLAYVEDRTPGPLRFTVYVVNPPGELPACVGTQYATLDEAKGAQ